MSEIDTSGIAEWRTEDGRLQLGLCNACGAPHYYPRRACPFCFSLDVGRVAATGRGRVYSYSAVGRGPNGPYVVAYVTLDEGVSILTNLVDVAPADVAIDLPVEVEFRDVAEVPTPFFRPAT